MRCQAFVSSTKDCCKKSAIKGSRYCLQHQPKVPLLIAIIIGIITGWVIPACWQAIFPPKMIEDIRSNTQQIPKMVMDFETIKGFVDTTGNEPNFNQNMWSMLTGIPAKVFKDYHDASVLFELKDYKNAAEKIQSAVSEYESVGEWDLKKYDSEQHKKQVSGFYLLAFKVNQRLNNNSLAYEYARKYLEVNPNHFAYYAYATASYNMGKYQQSLENINKAIELKPPDSWPRISVYQEIKEQSLKHLKN